MQIGSTLHTKIAQISTLHDLEAASFDLSFELQLQSHAICTVDTRPTDGKSGIESTMICGRSSTFHRLRYFDSQVTDIAGLARNPIVGLSPHAWCDRKSKWVQDSFLMGNDAILEQQSIDVALFVPTSSRSIACFFAIGLPVQNGVAETAKLHASGNLMIAKWMNLPAENADGQMQTSKTYP